MAVNNNMDESIHGVEFILGVKYIVFDANIDLNIPFKQLVIPENLKLGEILLKLPYGIVDKQITGIGATTLELNAKRNSIIVEPTKSIAYSKSLTNKDFFYVGSPIVKGQKKISESNINEYANNPAIEFKKMLVVADSLPKVIDAIGQSIYQDYFFMIDEVDSFQADSSYRNKLELCLDIYKKFPEQQRCLVTATMLKFSDPELSTEKFIQITYNKPVIRNIRLINTKTTNAVIANTIAELLEKDITAKVVIAYNVIGELAGVVDFLTSKFSIPDDDIKIVCSNSNKKKAGIHFSSILDEKLPGRINFLTSAYFIGVDINESFHCISVSNGNIPYTLLSDHKLKQIAGRCRTKLLSETVIFNCFNRRMSKLEGYQKDKLISLAKLQCSAMECFELQYKNEEALIDEILLLKKAIINQQNANSINLIRTNVEGNTKISYFSIDGILENNRTKQTLYSNPTQLAETLSDQGHKIELTHLDLDWEEDRSHDFKEDFEETIEEAILNLENHTSPLLNGIHHLMQNCNSPLQEEIYSHYIELAPYIEKDELISKISEFARIDRRHYKKYRMAVFFESLSSDNPFKKEIFENFIVGNKYTSEETRDKLSLIFKRYFLDMFLPKVEHTDDAVTALKIYFNTKIVRVRRKGVEPIRTHEIIGTNPLGIQIKGKNNPNSKFKIGETYGLDDNEMKYVREAP